VLSPLRGHSYPLGACLSRSGVNFSLFSKSASAVELLLFEHTEDLAPSRVIPLDPLINRAYSYWHIFVPGLQAGQLYGYRVSGPHEPEHGLRYDPYKSLLDPYGRAVVIPDGYNRLAASRYGETALSFKSVVVDSSEYDWEGDQPLRLPFSKTVIYEMHVAGFTRHPGSGLPQELRGTYSGLVEKIPYLHELGVTAVELLPVFAFDPQDAPTGLSNYWGYSPVSFFAPHPAYSASRDPLAVIDEFRRMVKALHKAGIEVILDVVYNHTAEGNENGPMLCLRGIENSVYYILDKDRRGYANYTGTGNTLNSNHPVVRRMILDSLRYWVRDMHVDGFRFDLASILSRDESGHPLENPPVIMDIDTDPVLAGTKLIAEAWDAAGLYQVGSFIGDNWREWNGKFRDDVRSFLRGDAGTVSRLAKRLLGSPDIYSQGKRAPDQSVNFVTCHDGFTLNDLVSYTNKHNQTNLQENRDGWDGNLSWNCGAEGPSDKPEVEICRTRQVKNFLTLNLLALGTPMLLMGDEVRRTQQGNNNAYCQDNELSWFDWSLVEKHPDIFRFVQRLIFYRLRYHPLAHNGNYTLHQLLSQAQIQWHGVQAGKPDWNDWSHSLAFTARSLEGQLFMHVMINAYSDALEFELPPVKVGSRKRWRRLLDTGLLPPQDIVDWQEASAVRGWTYTLQARSVVILFAAFQN
jgi:glycogen operon protein